MKKNKIDWKWLAGFWEGEGTVGSYQYKVSGYDDCSLQVGITQKEISLLIDIKEFLKKENINSGINFLRGGCGLLQIDDRQAERFLQKIFKLVISNRRSMQISDSINKVNKYKKRVKYSL